MSEPFDCGYPISVDRMDRTTSSPFRSSSRVSGWTPLSDRLYSTSCSYRHCIRSIRKVSMRMALIPPSSDLTVPEAAHDVVVDHPDRLHEGVTDRRSYEAEAPPLEILAHRSGVSGLGGDVAERSPPVADGTAAH